MTYYNLNEKQKTLAAKLLAKDMTNLYPIQRKLVGYLIEQVPFHCVSTHGEKTTLNLLGGGVITYQNDMLV